MLRVQERARPHDPVKDREAWPRTAINAWWSPEPANFVDMPEMAWSREWRESLATARP
ncbi:hypothetical protein ABIC75_000975 [Dyella japonica]|uniref:Uncharacterized protein n=1 Tax=Dyella japonica TaxID=231455 RepID=A0ABV2JU15_9GAMM